MDEARKDALRRAGVEPARGGMLRDDRVTVKPAHPDYLGDVVAAFRALEEVSPRKVEAKINNSDSNPHRYGVTLWNAFGKWYASEFTLEASIFMALNAARLDNFGMRGG